MKFRVERDVLSDAVAWAARTLPTRPSMPILSGLLVEADTAAGLVLSSFDYEVSARVEVAADVAEPGRTLVSGRLLAEIARSLPAQPVEIALEGTRVAVACGRSSFTLPTQPIEDYPALPSMPHPVGSINGQDFAAAVAQVAVAAGRDDTLPTLTGIRVEIVGSTVTMAATDRFRLAVKEFTWSRQGDASSEHHILVPARTLSDTAKALSGADIVTIALAGSSAGEGLAGFEGDGRRTTTRLLDGEFPKYHTLLPTECATTADVVTSEFVEAVKRVALVAERNTPVKLTFNDGELVLRAGSGEAAQASEVIECVLQGEAIEIAFNPTFLLDGLSAVDAPVTRLQFTVPQKPAVLVGVDDEVQRTDYRYLLMPVRLAG